VQRVLVQQATLEEIGKGRRGRAVTSVLLVQRVLVQRVLVQRVLVQRVLVQRALNHQRTANDGQSPNDSLSRC